MVHSVWVSTCEQRSETAAPLLHNVRAVSHALPQQSSEAGAQFSLTVSLGFGLARLTRCPSTRLRWAGLAGPGGARATASIIILYLKS